MGGSARPLRPFTPSLPASHQPHVPPSTGEHAGLSGIHDVDQRFELLLDGTPIERECVTRSLPDGQIISRTTLTGRTATIGAVLEVYGHLLDEDAMPVCRIVFDCAGSKVHLHVEQSFAPVRKPRYRKPPEPPLAQLDPP